MNDEPALPKRRRRKKRRRKSKTADSVKLPIIQQITTFLHRLKFTVTERAKERSLAWLVFVLLLTTSLAMDAVFRSGFIPGLFNGLTFLNFVVHELGHLAFQLGPEWTYVAAGTFVQLALPVGSVVMFVRQRDDAASCFALCWVAVSLLHTADYMADARSMGLDMSMSAGFWSLTSGQQVRPDELGHDWNYLLNSIGLLKWDIVLANTVRIFSGMIALGAVALNAYMVWVGLKFRRS